MCLNFNYYAVLSVTVSSLYYHYIIRCDRLIMKAQIPKVLFQQKSAQLGWWSVHLNMLFNYAITLVSLFVINFTLLQKIKLQHLQMPFLGSLRVWNFSMIIFYRTLTYHPKSIKMYTCIRDVSWIVVKVPDLFPPPRGGIRVSEIWIVNFTWPHL